MFADWWRLRGLFRRPPGLTANSPAEFQLLSRIPAWGWIILLL